MHFLKSLLIALWLFSMAFVAGCQADAGSRINALMKMNAPASQFHNSRHYADGKSPEDRIAGEFDDVRRRRTDGTVANVTEK
jgi:hypothetical protein